MFRRLCWILLAVACGKDLPPTAASIQRNVSLRSLAGCPAVEAAVQDSAVTEMRARLESAILNRHRWDRSTSRAAMRAFGNPGALRVHDDELQVAGVDEADIVKNDGTRIFALSSDRLHAASSWPPAALAVTGSLQIEGWPTVSSSRAIASPSSRRCPGQRPEGRNGPLPGQPCRLVHVRVLRSDHREVDPDRCQHARRDR